MFVLRNRNESINIEKKNRLHPYYLVYMSNEGEVLNQHTDPKTILDKMRSSSKHLNSPINQLCKAMNLETDDGYKMDKYSNLLKEAVKAIIRSEEQDNLNSLFTKGSNTIFGKSFAGLNDFELISFVVVK